MIRVLGEVAVVLLFRRAQALNVLYNSSFHAHVQILLGSGESII